MKKIIVGLIIFAALITSTVFAAKPNFSDIGGG